MSRKYKFSDQDGLYFVSFAVVNWIDVFTRDKYREIIIESLGYCSMNKGLVIYAYVIMSNHIHLLIGKKQNKFTLSDIMRDFKKYTAMKIIKAIRNNSQESRKDWMLELFAKAGSQNSNNTNFQFWQQDNHPLEISAEGKLENVIDYIHNNPVEERWVTEPEDYYYSSARNYGGRESVLKIISVYDGIEV